MSIRIEANNSDLAASAAAVAAPPVAEDPSIPPEVMFRIASFLPTRFAPPAADPDQVRSTVPRLAFIAQTSHERRSQVMQRMVQGFEKHPIIAWILNHSSLIPNWISDEQKVAIVRLYLKDLASLTELMSPVGRFIGGGSRLCDFYHEKARFEAFVQEQKAALGRILMNAEHRISSVPERIDFAGMEPLIVPIVFQDEKLCKSIDWELQHVQVIDDLCRMCLYTQQMDLFNEILPHSSMHRPNEAMSSDLLNQLLCLAAAGDQIELFKRLLDLGKPYDINQVLPVIARLKSRECITHLLTLDGIGAAPLHIALQHAAFYNRQDALDAILQARPGQALPRNVLERIKQALEQGPPEAEAQVYAQLATAEERQAMVARLTQEIANRYPPELEVALVSRVAQAIRALRLFATVQDALRQIESLNDRVSAWGAGPLTGAMAIDPGAARYALLLYSMLMFAPVAAGLRGRDLCRFLATCMGRLAQTMIAKYYTGLPGVLENV